MFIVPPKRIHQKIKDLKCESCEKSFVTKDSLYCHLKKIHQENESYNCDVCNRDSYDYDSYSCHDYDYHHDYYHYILIYRYIY